MSPSTTALVTGSNRGLGFEVVRQLAQNEMRVVLTARNVENAEAASDQLRQEGLDVHPMRLDVSDSQSVDMLLENVGEQFGVLDVLVNNAGSHFDPHHTASAVDLDFVREAMETNLFGAWRMIKAFLPLLRKSNHARIVNVASQAASLSDPFMPLGATGLLPAYVVSKAALHALTVKFANELKEESILVNAVGPGFTATFPGGAEMGARPVSEGAASIVWGAMLSPNGPTGGFFRDGEPLTW